MRINYNISALNVTKQLSKTNKLLSNSSAKLSSGLRINSARDDAAGLAISNKLDFQTRGIEKASKNTLDGVSMIQTLDGALSSVHDILQRMRELSVQSSNSTNTTEDREKIQIEINQLKDEIENISKSTQFNNINLLGGDAKRLVYDEHELASNVSYVSENTPAGTISYTIDKVGTPASATLNLPSGTTTVNASGSFYINGAEVSVSETDTNDIVTEKILNAFDNANLTYNNGKAYTLEEGKDKNIVFTDTTGLLSTLGITVTDLTSGTDAEISNLNFVDVNGEANDLFLDNAVVVANGNEVNITSINGNEINLKFNFGINPSGDFYIGDSINNATVAQDGAIDLDTSTVITDRGALKIHTGVRENMDIDVYIPELNLKNFNLENLNITTFIGAQQGIDDLDKAIEIVSKTRAITGALQNRFEYNIENLDTAYYNTSQSLSRIRDVDMAKEMTAFTQEQVKYQAGISILAQANQRPQMILQLLG